MSDLLKCSAIDRDNLRLFTEYCRTYRFDHDESDLYEEDLDHYDPVARPGFLLQAATGEVVGVIAYRKMPHVENLIRARLVIWHVKTGDPAGYEQLLEAIQPELADVDHVFGFFPEAKEEVRQVVTSLGWTLDRYVWVLVRDDVPVEVPSLREGWSLRSFEGIEDARDWCEVRNRAFETVKGSEAPMSEARAMELFEEVGSIPGGMLILSFEGRPAGVIRVLEEIEHGKSYTFVAPIAIHPEFQGKGLGRWLLRAGLHHGRTHGCPYGMLSVNAENERAADLYLSEGFEKELVMMCYHFKPALGGKRQA